MAKIQEETFVIKLSKLVREEVKEPDDIIEDRIILNAESLIQQLVNDPTVIVEIFKE